MAHPHPPASDDERPTVAWSAEGTASPHPPAGPPPSPAPPARGSGSRTGERASLPTAGSRIGPFVIEKMLGRGGMGAVFRARHEQTGAPYAIKVILDSAGSGSGGESNAVARFRREAELLSRLSHPGIVRVHATGVHAGNLYTVMELVEGQTLQARIDADGPLPIDEAIEMTAALADALAYAHAAGIFHRDLKPANVLIDPTGRPRLLDFGLARETSSEERLTRTGTAIGTPEFMAPEQFEESERTKMGPTTDVYGLGALLYVMLTADPPLGTGDKITLMVRVLSRYPDAPSTRRAGVPPEVEAICLKCLEKEAPDRYGSVADLAHDIAQFRRGLPTAARPLGRFAHRWRRWVPARGRRRRLAILAFRAGVALLVLGGAGGIFVGYRQFQLVQDKIRREKLADDERELRMLRDEVVHTASRARALRAGALAEELTKKGHDYEPELRRTAIGLERVARGDDRFIRTLALEDALWAPHAEGVLRLLIDPPAEDALDPDVAAIDSSVQLERAVALLDRNPAVLSGKPDLADTLVEKIDEVGERTALGPRVTDALIAVFDRASRRESPAAPRRERYERRYYEMITRRLADMFASDEIDRDAMAKLLGPLCERVSLTGETPRLGSSAARGLLELTLRRLDDEAARRVSEEETRLLTVALELPDLKPTERERLVQAAMRNVIDAAHSSDFRQQERGWKLAVLLVRVDSYPLGVESFETLFSNRSTLSRWLDQLLAPEGDDWSPITLYCLLASLVNIEITRNAPKLRGGDRRSRERRAEQRAVLDLWGPFEKLLARALVSDDVPAVATVWVATVLDHVHVWDKREDKLAPGEKEGFAPILENLIAALPDRDLRPDAPEPYYALVDDLYRLAHRRNLERDRLDVLQRLAAWLRDRGKRSLSRSELEETVDIAVAVLRGTRAGWARDRRRDPITSETSLPRVHSTVRRCGELIELAVTAHDAPAVGPDACPLSDAVARIADAAAAVSPNDGHVFIMRAFHLAFHGRTGAAADVMTEGSAREQELPGRESRKKDIYLYHAHLLAEAGRADETREVLGLTRGLIDDDDDGDLEKRARIWERIGDRERAAEDREAARRARRR